MEKEERQSPLDNVVKEKYWEEAELALQGGEEQSALSKEVVELIRETNAKMKEIGKEEAPVALISNCMILLNPMVAMATIEAMKNVVKIKVLEGLKSSIQEEK